MKTKKYICFFAVLLAFLTLLAINAFADEHDFEDGACAVCGYVKENVVQGSDGNWYYVVDDQIQWDYTGLKSCRTGFWRIENGKVNFSAYGIFSDGSGDWFVSGGKVDKKCNDVLYLDNNGVQGWWLIRNGKVSYENTLAENKWGEWYCNNGKVDLNFTGIFSDENGDWFVSCGKVQSDCNDILYLNNNGDIGWWVIRNGKVDSDVSGIFSDENGDFYVSEGKVKSDCNDILYLDNNGDEAWWLIKNGKVSYENTVAQNENGWWRVENGKVNFSYNGLALNDYGLWYIENGRLNFSYNGLACYENCYWNVENGYATSVSYQIADNIELSGGDYNLTYGCEGLKVRSVIQYFNLGDGVGMNNNIYNSTVQNYVSNFQSNNALSVTGNVDLNTWLKMGFSEEEWYYRGAYVHKIYAGTNSTRSEHIEAMIKAAYEYLGDPYVIGASGAPGYGVDCSGLVMQSLYASGLDMLTINPVTHAQPGHEYESKNIWNQNKFQKVSFSERKRGDLIFYGSSASTIYHVAIYLGDDMIIDAWPNKVSVVSVYSRGTILGVMRPFT